MENDGRSIGNLINLISKDIHFYFRSQLKEYDMGWGQFKILVLLLNSGSMKQEEISCQLGVDKTTVARTLKKLESSNLIERKIDPIDKRAHLVYLTDKSKELADYLREIKRDINNHLLADLSESEIETLFTLLYKLKNNSSDVLKENLNE